MTLIKIETFLDMQDDVLRRQRQDLANVDVRNLVKGFLNARYQEVSGEDKWRWKRAPKVLKVIAKHTTGTVAATNNNRLLTFTTASITAVMVNRKIKLAGDSESYRIIAVDVSAQTAIIDSFYIGTTATGVSYTIFKDEYGLSPDVEDIDDVTNNYSSWPIKRKSPEYVSEKFNRSPGMIGKPKIITIDGVMPYEGIAIGSGSFVMGSDFMGVPESIKAKIYPAIADADYSVPYIAVRKAAPMDADSDQPLMFVDDRIVLIFGALADLAEYLKDNTARDYWETKYNSKVKQMLVDNQETDDQLQLVVEDVWRCEISTNSYGSVDYGILFDTN